MEMGKNSCQKEKGYDCDLWNVRREALRKRKDLKGGAVNGGSGMMSILSG